MPNTSHAARRSRGVARKNYVKGVEAFIAKLAKNREDAKTISLALTPAK